MSASLPKAQRIRGNNRGVILALAATVAVLCAALVYLLLAGSLFSQEPRTDLERDYRLLSENLSKNPSDAATLMSLAEVEYEMGKRRDAFEHASRAIEVAGDRPYFNMRYATLLVREDKLKDAEKALKAEIVITEGGDAEPYFLLAQVQSSQGDVDTALKTMQKGLSLSPMAADMIVVYGGMLEKDGKDKQAIAQYKKALTYLPDDQEAISALKRLGVTYEPTTTAPHATSSGE